MFTSLSLLVYCLVRFTAIHADIDCDKCKNIVCESVTCPEDSVELPNLRGLCGCCSGCVRFKKLNDLCEENADPVQSDSNPLIFNSDECAPDLNCDYNDAYDLICKHPALDDKDKPCAARLMSFTEKEQTEDWFWHATCYIDGTFMPKQCKQDKCFCVDQNGNRIFGTFRLDEVDDTNCVCSLMELELQEKAKIGDSMHTGRFDHVTCQRNGNFQKLQCLKDVCLCVNEMFGNVTSVMVPKTMAHLLPCYVDEDNFKSLFNTPCQTQREHEEQIASYYTKKGVSYSYVNPVECNPDGTYVPKQCSAEYCFCVNPHTGVVIDGYTVPAISYLAAQMNCQCVTDRNKVSTDGGISHSFNCIENGNYRMATCFRFMCYCVDEDGFRASKELNVEKWSDNFCGIPGDDKIRVKNCIIKGYNVDCDVKNNYP